MIRTLQLLSIAALACMVSVAQAGEKAATSKLPAALQAVGAADSAILSQAAAQEVRGQALSQSKMFTIDGSATGSVTLLEGLLANIKFVQIVPPPRPHDDPSALLIEGTIGGLEGRVGVNHAGGLSFSLQGKALSETLDFTGSFSQHFDQYYEAW